MKLSIFSLVLSDSINHWRRHYIRMCFCIEKLWCWIFKSISEKKGLMNQTNCLWLILKRNLFLVLANLCRSAILRPGQGLYPLNQLSSVSLSFMISCCIALCRILVFSCYFFLNCPAAAMEIRKSKTLYLLAYELTVCTVTFTCVCTHVRRYVCVATCVRIHTSSQECKDDE